MKIRAALAAAVFLLASVGPGQAKRALAPVHLNHFYVVVDSTTYEAIAQSAFLRRELARTEQRTTVRKDMTYSGVYLYGTNTYFEFLEASDEPSRRPGSSGVAFGVDRPGALGELARDAATGISVVAEPISREFEGRQVPWFYIGGHEGFSSESGLLVWFMEYHPRVLAEWNPRPGRTRFGVSRREVLERYAAVLEDVPSRPLLEDVAALTIAVDEPTHKKLVDLVTPLGYA